MTGRLVFDFHSVQGFSEQRFFLDAYGSLRMSNRYQDLEVFQSKQRLNLGNMLLFVMVCSRYAAEATVLTLARTYDDK
jgi:hypothetical protein